MRFFPGKNGWKRNIYAGMAGREGGFTYLGLLAIIAVMGVVMVGTGEVWHIAQKREKERELLFVGDQFRRAIRAHGGCFVTIGAKSRIILRKQGFFPLATSLRLNKISSIATPKRRWRCLKHFANRAISPLNGLKARTRR